MILTFDVDEGTELGPETRAEIAAATLLGGYYLRLSGPVGSRCSRACADDDARRHPARPHPQPAVADRHAQRHHHLVEAIDIESVNQVMARARRRHAPQHRAGPRAPRGPHRHRHRGAAHREAQIRDLIGNGEQITEALASPRRGADPPDRRGHRPARHRHRPPRRAGHHPRSGGAAVGQLTDLITHPPRRDRLAPRPTPTSSSAGSATTSTRSTRASATPAPIISLLGGHPEPRPAASTSPSRASSSATTKRTPCSRRSTTS